MDTLAEQRAFFQTSARRFADHYRDYAQAYELSFTELDEELDNMFLALTTYRRIQAWPDIAYLARALNIFLGTRGYWNELRFWLEESICHQEQIDDSATRLQILRDLADVTCAQGDLSKAESLYEEAIELAEQIGDKVCLGEAYFGLFSVYQNQGRIHEAKDLLNLVPALAQQAGSKILEQSAYYFLEATTLPQRGRKRLPQILNSVTQLAKTLGHSETAFTLSLRAWAHLVLGQRSKAQQYYLKALPYVRRDKDAQGTAFVLYQLGSIAALDNDVAGALAYYQESRAIAEHTKDQIGLLLLYSSLGLLFMGQERFDLARPYVEQSVLLARGFGNQEDVAHQLYWLGYAVANTGDPKRAEQLFEESLAIYTQLGSPEAERTRDALSRLRAVLSREDA